MKIHFHASSRRTAFVTGAVAATVILFIIVILSPLALGRFGTATRLNWSQLSNIGQTYGAVSALLTAMALVGVVASLLFQARDIKLAREQAIRTFHHELIRMELDNPLYMAALGVPWDMPMPPEQDRMRQYLYIHLWVSFWQTFYTIGMMPEDQLRRACERELFRGRPGREYWEYARSTRPLYTKDRRSQHFEKILDEEYGKAIASQPASVPPIIASQTPTTGPRRDKSHIVKVAGTLLMAAATGALIDRVVNRRA
jgi:hypothetical protein